MCRMVSFYILSFPKLMKCIPSSNATITAKIHPQILEMPPVYVTAILRIMKKCGVER